MTTRKLRKLFKEAESVSFLARNYNVVKYRSIAIGDLEYWIPLEWVLQNLGFTPESLRSAFPDSKPKPKSYDDLGALPLERRAFAKLAGIFQKTIVVVRELGGSEDSCFYLFTVKPPRKRRAA